MASKQHFRPLLRSIAACTLLLVSSIQSTAQDSVHVVLPAERELKEVVVSAPARILDTPQQTIARSQLQSIASASVADALKYMAGVQIKDYGGLGGQKTVNVRSLGSQHIGVYIDGVRVTNAQNGTVDLGKYSLTTLESVSLFNANKNETLMMASEYASAATVYLQTHRPDKTELTASASIGSFGTYKGAATFSFSPSQSKTYSNSPFPNSGGAGGGLSGFIDAAFTSSRGDYPFAYHTQYEDTTGTRRNSDLTLMRVEGALWWRGWQLHTYYFDSERGLPGGIVRRLSHAYTDVGREWDRNFFTQLSYRRQMGVWGVRGIFKYTNDWLHYRSDYPENIAVHANNRYHQQDAYGALAAACELPLAPECGELRLSASTDLRWSNLTCDVKHFKYVYRLDTKTSLAAFYKLRRLSVSLGALFTDIRDHQADNPSTFKPAFTYNALAAYSIGDLTLRAFYKSVFRAPTLNDLYYTLVGNRRLKPEYTKQFDIGLTYSLSPHSGGVGGGLSVDFYCNRVTDRIVCLPLKGSYQWTMLNYGYTRCLGVNLSANLTLPFAQRRGSHQLMISGAFQDDRDLTDRRESSYNDFIAYSPRWSLTAVYTLLYKGWTASLSHMFVDKRYWTAENAIEEPLGAYNCTDVKVGYSFRRPRLSVELECQNLFDQRYEIIQRWPMPGRRLAMTLKINL